MNQAHFAGQADSERELAKSFLDIFHSPELMLYSLSFKPDKARFRRMSGPAEYREHLGSKDDGLIAVDLNGLLEMWKEFQKQEQSSKNPPQFIFMTDYCCSTLLINMLGELTSCLSLNESHALASVAAAKRGIRKINYEARKEEWQDILRMTLSLSARTYSPDQTAVLKEYTPSNYIIGEILAASTGSSAVFMYSSLESYLASVLKSEARKQLVNMRVNHLHVEYKSYPAFAEMDLKELDTDSKRAAFHWLIQMYSVVHQNVSIPKEKIRSLDGDALVQEPEKTLRSVVDFFKIPADEHEIKRTLDSPVMTTHSKSGKSKESGFTAESRQQELKGILASHQREISEGVEWAEKIRSEFPFENALPPPLF